MRSSQRATSEVGTTPPDKIGFLPTPPSSTEKPSAAVFAAIQLFQRNHRGLYITPWAKLHLSEEEYIELWRQLELEENHSLGEYVRDKVRYE
jgi:hypothetical protein